MGGAGAGAVLLIVVVVVVLALTGVFGGGNPQPGSVDDLIPDDAELIIKLDIGRLLADDDLIDYAEEEGIYDLDEDLFGIDPEDIAEMIVVESDGSEVIILKGSFDLEDIRDELEDGVVEENTYRGYEVWEGEFVAIALFEEYVVGSSDSVRAVEGNTQEPLQRRRFVESRRRRQRSETDSGQGGRRPRRRGDD